MKKKLTLILTCILVIMSIFSACSTEENDRKSSIESAEQKEQSHVPTTKEDEKNSNNNTKKNENMTIADQEAIKKVQGYSAKQLGLEGKLKDYSFLAATEKKKIEGKEYVEVVASIITKNDKKDTVKIDTKGTYYVRLDGKKCLKKDMKTGKMIDLE